MSGTTALQAVEQSGALLVHGAAGAVGSLAVAAGARVPGVFVRHRDGDLCALVSLMDKKA